MSDLNDAQTGATVAPAQNSGEPQVSQKISSNTTSEQVEQTTGGDQERDEAGRFVPKERFNKVYGQAKQNERRAQAADEELQRLRQVVETQQRQTQMEVPRIEDYQDANQWAAAITEKAVSQAIHEAESRINQSRTQSQYQEQVRSFQAREQAYAAENPAYLDRVEVLSQSVNISEVMFDVLSTSEHGPHVADYLAQNLEEADLISRLPVAQAAARLGRIEAKVSTPKAKPVTNAPAPVPTLGGGSALSKNPADMSYQEYRKFREAG